MAKASSGRVVEDAATLLRTIHDELREDRRPYSADVRRIIERGLVLRYPEYVQFLERYGFLTLDRRTDLLKLTKAGQEVARGSRERLQALAGDASYYFGDRLAQVEASAVPEEARGVRFDKRFLRYDALGAGGIGTVYRGRLLSTDRPVAIKVVAELFALFAAEQRQEIIRRLQLAVRDHARLVSPFIVQILDQGVAADDTPYYVMELAGGGSLRALLDQHGKLEPAIALRYFIQIALGLRVAHNQRILHRDLKPANVLLDESGNVKISDFGITRIVERDGQAVRQAYVGFGSVGYMAPEMFHPTNELGPQVDVYALGILLYEMLTGTLPGRRSPMPSEVVKGVPTDLDDIFDQMTQDGADRRLSSTEAVLQAIWDSEPLVEMLDPFEAPLFIESALELPGLPAPAIEAPRASAPPAAQEPAGTPLPRIEQESAAVAPIDDSEDVMTAGSFADDLDDLDDLEPSMETSDLSLAEASELEDGTGPPTAQDPPDDFDEPLAGDSLVQAVDPSIFEAHGLEPDAFEQLDADDAEFIEEGEVFEEAGHFSTAVHDGRQKSKSPKPRRSERTQKAIDEKLARLRRK